MDRIINVGLGELVVSQNPAEVLVAYGLGSCLGISMYDPHRRIAGLLHAVLPERLNGGDTLQSKYVNSGLQRLLEQMTAAGAHPQSLVLRMAGGANMLASPSLSQTFDIGTRNIKSARQTAEMLGLQFAAQEVGGNMGRTVRLYVSTGRMTVRTIGGQERDL